MLITLGGECQICGCFGRMYSGTPPTTMTVDFTADPPDPADANEVQIPVCGSDTYAMSLGDPSESTSFTFAEWEALGHDQDDIRCLAVSQDSENCDTDRYIGGVLQGTPGNVSRGVTAWIFIDVSTDKLWIAVASNVAGGSGERSVGFKEIGTAPQSLVTGSPSWTVDMPGFGETNYTVDSLYPDRIIGAFFGTTGTALVSFS